MGWFSVAGRWTERTWASIPVRIALIVLSVLLWIPVLFILGIVLGINPIVRSAVERLGTTALAVPVRLDRASISFAGAARLGRLSVPNPEGYEGDYALTFQAFMAHIPIPAVFRDVIDVPELTVMQPDFSFVLGGKHERSNWGRLIHNLAEAIPKKGGLEVPTREKQFIIHRLRIVQPIVRFRTKSMGEPIVLHLKDIELKDVGTGPGSKSKTYVVLSAILQALLTGGIKEGKNLPGSVKGPLQDELAEAGKTFSEVLKESK